MPKKKHIRPTAKARPSLSTGDREPAGGRRLRTKPPRTKAGPILWTLSILVAAFGVFWLPWCFGPTKPSEGESYAFGFNNHVGVLALGLSILLGMAACYLSGRRRDFYKWIQMNPRLFPQWKEARAEYMILIGICAVMAVFISVWAGYLVDPAWCEARGFIYGMDLLALGQVPYRDFMYNYGPATLYLPLWLSQLSGGLLSIEQAYAIILVLFTICGFVGLFVVLRSFEMPKSMRPLALGLAALVWTGLSMGLQYTPLRFLVVPISLVFLDANANWETAISLPLRLGLGAAIAAAACLAVSPEMGISGTVAVAAYGFILALRRSIAGAAACWVGVMVVCAATLRAFPGYLDSVFAFGSGGANFPIYPDLYNLCLVAISLITLPRLIVSALADPREKRAPLALALAVGGGMLLPAAFGRCDPGHVTYNSMIPALLMFPAAAAAGRTPLQIWTAVYAILAVILLQVSYWNQYTSNYAYGIQMHGYYDAHPDLVASWKEKWDALRRSTPRGMNLRWSKVLPYPEELEQFTSKGRVLLTSGNEGNLWLARFLLLQKNPPREYFDAYSQGASTPEQIGRKLREDEAYEYLIIPQSVLAPLGGQINLDAYAQGTDAFLSKLLLFPVNSVVKNPPYLPDTEFARRILDDYKPVGRYESYVILDKKTSTIP